MMGNRMGFRPCGVWMALAIAMFALVNAVPALAQDIEDQVAEHFSKGVKLYDGKELNKALTEFLEAKKLDPKNAPVLKWIGFIYIETGRPSDAIEPLEELTKLPKGADDPEAWMNLGNAYEGVNRVEDALKAYNKVIMMRPDSADPHFNIGNLYFKKRDYAKAATSFLKASTLNEKDPFIFQNLGFAYQMTNRNKDAVLAHQKAMKIDPMNARFALNAGRALLLSLRETPDNSKTKLECRNAYSAAVLREPNNIEARMGYGEALMEMRDYAEAAVQFRAAVKIDAQRYEPYYNLGMALAQSNQTEAALSAYRTALERAGDKPEEVRDSLQGIGLMEFRREKFADSEKTFARLTKDFPLYVEGWANLGYVRLKRTPPDYDAAITGLEQGIQKVKSGKDKARLQRILGACYYERGVAGKRSTDVGDASFLSKAQDSYNQSLIGDAENAEAYHGLGLVASRLGKQFEAEAIRNFNRAINIKPAYANAHNDLGAIYLAQGNKSKALQCFETAIRHDPDNQQAVTNRNNLRKALKKP